MIKTVLVVAGVAFLGASLCLIAFFVILIMTPSRPVATTEPVPTAESKEAMKPKTSPPQKTEVEAELRETVAKRSSTPIAPTAGDGRKPYDRTFSDPFLQNTYESAVEICYYNTPEFIASDLGVANNSEAIARAFSMGSVAGPHREVGYIGCLEGLLAPGAGRKQQYRYRR